MMASRADERPRSGDLVARARAYAASVHADDVRKGSGVPYFEGHLEPVARIVADNGGSEVQVAAAYLHDAVEDHGGLGRLRQIEAEFGPDVAEIVEDLSDSFVDTDAGEAKAPWRQRKLAYLDSLVTEPERSLVVAAADKLHNAQSMLDDLVAIEGDAMDFWSRFTVSDPQKHLWYYGSLTAAIRGRLGDHPTAVELSRVVTLLVAEVDRRDQP